MNKEVDYGFVKWFSELSSKDVPIAGGKGASLAEMYNHKFPIPPGFIVTAHAYAYFIEKAGLVNQMHSILDGLDVENTKKLDEASKKIKDLIKNADMPREMQQEIIEAYDILDVSKDTGDAKGTALSILKKSHEPPFVAVRSSATAEDLADASFAGQQESFLNVKGHGQLIQKVKECLASLFTARAIYYRTKKGFDHMKTKLAVVVQRMVDSDKSGVMFSKNPVKNDDTIMIESVWGLGEGIVSGMIKPDNYIISRNLDDFKVLSITISEKKLAITRDSSGENKTVKLTSERANQQVLSNYEIKYLAQQALHLEDHYGKPQDIEFAISGKDIYIVQSRPITTKAHDGKANLSGNVLLSGLGASPGVGWGPVRIVHSLEELEKVKKGDVLVTIMTNPDMVVDMQKAAAIVTDEGGITSHAAIVSREMGIPAVVGTGNATSVLKDGMIITVDGSNGKVIEGKGETKQIEILPIVPTKTKIKVIVDLPDFAPRAAKSGSKAVGLVRLEGIIAESGKHPMYFVKKNNMKAYEDVIYRGLKEIALHFEEVWVRTSDLRSDEFLHLEGAPQDHEGNPMLGDHGVRFSLKHKDIMSAEIAAMHRIAIEYPNKIMGIMVPQVISVEEVKETKEIAAKIGIPKNVKVGIMVETPAAVQVINEICELGIDFVSFGTNDLTQYTLAIDRNNPGVQHLFNEMNPAVLNSLRYVIRRCKKYGVETSICGQAGSKPEMATFLIQEGIDSLSVNADAAQKVSMTVAQIENSRASGIEISQTQRHSEHNMPTEAGIEIQTIKKPYRKEDDIENVILKELETDYMSSKPIKKDIPALNDAIPVDSQMFDSMADIEPKS
jgi:pyruvate, water dikinase